MGKVVEVKISQMKVATDLDSDTKIIIPEIVAGVGVVIYDFARRLCGAIHIILPRCFPGYQQDALKFADTAIPLLLEALIKKGADKEKLIVKIAGGAEAISSSSKKLGANNVLSVKDTASKWGLTIAGEDTGNHYKRDLSVSLDSTGCKILVKRYGAQSVTL